MKDQVGTPQSPSELDRDDALGRRRGEREDVRGAEGKVGGATGPAAGREREGEQDTNDETAHGTSESAACY